MPIVNLALWSAFQVVSDYQLYVWELRNQVVIMGICLYCLFLISIDFQFLLSYAKPSLYKKWRRPGVKLLLLCFSNTKCRCPLLYKQIEGRECIEENIVNNTILKGQISVFKRNDYWMSLYKRKYHRRLGT